MSYLYLDFDTIKDCLILAFDIGRQETRSFKLDGISGVIKSNIVLASLLLVNICGSTIYMKPYKCKA